MSSSCPKLAAIFVAILALFCLATTRRVEASHTWICNRSAFAAGSAYDTSVNHVLNDLVQNTHKHRNYNAVSPFATGKIYGHATCNRAISGGECTSCLNAARTVMFDRCRLKFGGQVRRGDNCFLRYETYKI